MEAERKSGNEKGERREALNLPQGFGPLSRLDDKTPELKQGTGISFYLSFTALCYYYYQARHCTYLYLDTQSANKTEALDLTVHRLT